MSNEKSKHTPGDWKAEIGNYSEGHRFDGTTWTVSAKARDVCHMATKDDARLMAAAKKLLDACKAAKNELDGWLATCGEDEIRDSFQGFVEAADACESAIARAEGSAEE